MKEKKNIVVFGGGNGSAITLRALKQSVDIYTISAIIAMTDSGGSSGVLRKEFDSLPPGDIMRAILALSSHSYSDTLKPIFYETRFQDEGKLTGHNLGNLFLTWASQYSGNFLFGIRALEQAVRAQGTVHPCTLEAATLMGRLSDGTHIAGESELDEPQYSRDLTLEKVWIHPLVAANPDALLCIAQADYIVLGPGSLHTSVIASLLPTGIYEAIEKSTAPLIYIAGNKYEVNGETGPTSVDGCVQALEQYLPRAVNTIIFNGSPLTPVQQAYYDKKGWAIFDYTRDRLTKYTCIETPFELPEGGLDTQKLGEILREILI